MNIYLKSIFGGQNSATSSAKLIFFRRIFHAEKNRRQIRLLATAWVSSAGDSGTWGWDNEVEVRCRMN